MNGLLFRLLLPGAFVSVLLVTSSSFAASARDGDWLFLYDNSTATIINYYGSSSSVTIPSTVTRIEEWQEEGEDGEFHTLQRSYTYSVTAIDGAFRGCTSLTSVKIPSSVTSLVGGSFQRCSNLRSVTIPSRVTSIGDATFFGCTRLKSVTIPKSVKSIGTAAFYQCTSLSSVTIPNSVTSIGIGAFMSSGLTTITVPASVTSIGLSSFANCTSLKTISVGAGNHSYSSENGLLLSKNGTTVIEGVNGDVVIPDGVTSIQEQAFLGRSNLTSVKIPKSVTSIGSHAFDCSSKRMEVWFEGAPPENCNSSTFSASNGRGHYPFSFESEWLPHIDTDGRWNGLVMSTYGLDYIVRLHGNGVVTDDGANWVDIPMTFGRWETLPKNPFSRFGTLPADYSNQLLGWSGGTSAFDWTRDNIHQLCPPRGSIYATEQRLLEWSELGWAEVINGIPTVHFSAVWNSEVVVDICGKFGSSLSPASLKDHVKFKVGYDGQWRTGGTTVRVPPGTHTLRIGADPGYEIRATSWRVLMGGIERGDGQNGVYSFEIGSHEGPLTIPLEVLVSGDSELGSVQFSCTSEMTDAQRSAWPMFPEFHESLVQITLMRQGFAGEVAVQSDELADMPAGTYLAEISYKDRPKMGVPYWSTSQVFVPEVQEIQIRTEELTKVSVVFRPFGSKTVNCYWISFDGKGGIVSGDNPLWFGDCFGSVMTSLSDNSLPTAKRSGGWKFDGWYTQEGVHVPDSGALEQMLRPNPRNLVLEAHWSSVQAATGTGVIIPYDWMEKAATTILSSVDGDFEAAAIATAENGQAVWECYMTGLDPEYPDSHFEAKIALVDGNPVVTPSPDLGTNRVYTVEAKSSLEDEHWGEPDENSRFFRIKVSLPEL